MSLSILNHVDLDACAGDMKSSSKPATTSTCFVMELKCDPGTYLQQTSSAKLVQGVQEYSLFGRHSSEIMQITRVVVFGGIYLEMARENGPLACVFLPQAARMPCCANLSLSFSGVTAMANLFSWAMARKVGRALSEGTSINAISSTSRPKCLSWRAISQASTPPLQ